MFLEAKTIEAASYLLARLEGAGEAVPYIKLIKLLYLADREQVYRKGRSISGDTYWSLPYGPILSHTLNAIKSLDESWTPFIGVDLDAKVVWLKSEAPFKETSRADRAVLDEIVEKFGHLPWQELVDYTHSLPEWRRPEGSAKRQRIYLEDIARAVGHDGERVRAIVDAERERPMVRQFMSQFEVSDEAAA